MCSAASGWLKPGADSPDAEQRAARPDVDRRQAHDDVKADEPPPHIRHCIQIQFCMSMAALPRLTPSRRTPGADPRRPAAGGRRSCSSSAACRARASRRSPSAAGFTRGAFYSNFTTPGGAVHRAAAGAGVRGVHGDGRGAAALRGSAADGARVGRVPRQGPGQPGRALDLPAVARAARPGRPRPGAARAGGRLLAGQPGAPSRRWCSVASARAARRSRRPPTQHGHRALIAMDIGLAIQHYVDPDAVPLDVYPELFGAARGRTRSPPRAWATSPAYCASASSASTRPTAGPGVDAQLARPARRRARAARAPAAARQASAGASTSRASSRWRAIASSALRPRVASRSATDSSVTSTSTGSQAAR